MEKNQSQAPSALVLAREARSARADRLKRMRDVGAALSRMVKKEDEELYSRQEQKDEFEGLYDENRLLEPPYSFNYLYLHFEKSDVLQECADAMIQNVDGFGWQGIFLGDDLTQRQSSEAQAELRRMTSFFNQANESQSFRTIRKLMRLDYEVLGNGAFEVVRNRKGEVQLIYYIPFRKVRVSAIDGKQIPVDAVIMRDGKPVVVRVKKYFRKFCSLHPTTSRRLRWFKEFGDPRTLDALTGEYTDSPKMVASELLHLKQPFGGSVYGIPRWIGAVVEVLGRTNAQFVNYDLFNNQGIPPMAIMVSGGVLTDQSLDELEGLIRGMRGAEQWNKILVLESTLESIGVEEKGSARIELKNLTEYRKEDQMFDRYLTTTEKTIRHRWRLPPLYVGGAETFTHATARAAQTVAEEQVFIPEREGFDEEINMKIVVPELKVTQWAYKTKGPRIVGADEITTGITSFANAGALTVNHAIDLANRAFGLEMSKFNEKWADYPIALILSLVESGRLKGLEEIDEGPPPAAPVAGPARGKQTVMKVLPDRIFKGDDLFSPEEKLLYKRLKTLQLAAETAMQRGGIYAEADGGQLPNTAGD